MAAPDRYIDGGFIIYPRGNSVISYQFNLIMGEDGRNAISTKPNENRQQIDTFGKYPGIFYVGNKHYKTFQLKTVFTSAVLEATAQPYHDIILLTAYEEYLRFEKNVRQRRQWAVRGAMVGDDHICDISIVSVDYEQNALAYKNDSPTDDDCCDNIQYMDYIEVTIECVEVDDFIYGKDDIL